MLKYISISLVRNYSAIKIIDTNKLRQSWKSLNKNIIISLKNTLDHDNLEMRESLKTFLKEKPFLSKFYIYFII